MDKSEVCDIILKTKAIVSDSLDLSNKGITELPDELGQLTHLKSLDLSYNQITHLPPSILKLKKLEKLYLLRNSITEIPSGIGSLTKLKVLDISYNPIKNLPSTFGMLHNLENLDASYCKLQSLPFEITELLSLKTLILDENPMQLPPQKVVQRGLYAIMHYLAIEKRKTEASQVIVNVFNMPEKIQLAFKQYNQLFSNIVSKINHKELSFDVNFINQDFYQQMELNSGIDSYLMDVIQYINEKMDIKNTPDPGNLSQMLLEMRLKEIKEQLMSFHLSLDDKVESIMHMKNEIEGLYKLLESKKNG